MRRLWEFLPYVGKLAPFVFHFDFVDSETGQLVMSGERHKSLDDLYTITVPDRRIDFRVAASVAIALDAFEER